MDTTSISQELSTTVMGGVMCRSKSRRVGSRKHMTIAELVRTLRARSRMKQHEFAKAIRVTRGAVAKYESGDTRPSLYKIEIMARLAGLNVSDLLSVPTTKDSQDRTEEDRAARGNLEICLNSPNRELVVTSLAYFAGRSPKASK